jgi:methylated-DNA-[protein]-cysteine S-methyltransferase
MTVRYAVVSSPVGRVGLAWREDGTLVAAQMDVAESRTTWETGWEPGGTVGHLRGVLSARFGAALRLEKGSEDAEAPRALRAYFAGDPRALDALRVDPGGTEFQATVWRELRRIPAGKTRTYGELAAAIGRPAGARAAGGAVGSNPIPLVIPCHRILGGDGRLTGFGGGIARKRWLLRHEGARFRDPAEQLSLV